MMASNPRWRDEREAKLVALHDQLTATVEALVSGEDWVRAITFAAQFRSRSFANTLLIYAAHAERYAAGRVSEPWPTYVAGYRQWESLGRHVLKGQHGYMILAPVLKRLASATPGDPNSWRELGFREKPRPGEQVRRKIVNVKPAYVWDVSQTQGDPVPQRPSPRLPVGDAPAGLWDGVAGLIRAEGFELSRATDAIVLGGADGVTDYGDRTVRVRADMDAAAQVKTLVHELAHVRMHEPGKDGVRRHRGVGEVEAESVAMMVAAAPGMPTEGYTVPYVSTWATTVKDRTPVEVVRATGEKVRAVALSILNALDTVQTGGGDPPGLDREKLATGQVKAPSMAPVGVEVPPLAGVTLPIGA
jgi:antirestriction protein ArdC